MLRSVAWYSDSLSAEMASVRLRVLKPVEALRGMGIEAGLYDAGIGAARYDGIVFSKSFSASAAKAARLAAAAGRQVIVDLCDNVLAKPPSWRRHAEHARVREMLELADRVTFATPMLAEQMAARVPGIADKSVVVPDALDTLSFVEPDSRRERRRLGRLRHFLGANAGALHCVWFGKSKLGYSGIEHLHPVVRRLEALSTRRPVTLTVISNSWPLYRLESRGWRIPSFYARWSMDSFGPALAMHDVAVIPVERNGYTLGKTVNRPATALLAGLGVIADAIPSYEELRQYIVLDDWEGGFERYMARPTRNDPLIVAGQAHLERRYGAQALAARWVEVLRGTRGVAAAA